MLGAGGFRAWLIVFSCPPPQNPTFPATFGEWRSFVNAMWAERGSRGKFMEATCSSRVRARLTKCISNRRPVKNSTIFPSTSPSSRSWPRLRRVPGKSPRVAALTQLLAAHLVEKYTNTAGQTPVHRGGLPIHQLRKVEDYVAEHLAEEISIEALAELVELSSSHFSHVFKESTGMTPLQFVTRQRITRAEQLIRETSRSLIEVGLEVGYTSPSHFAQVFRRVVGITPTEFRSSL